MSQLAFDLSVMAAKTTIVLLFVFVLYRLVGKRQVAQFNVYDLVTVVALANAVQNSMTMGKGDLAVGFVCSFTLMIVGWLLSRLVVKAPKTERVLFGTPTIILSEGHALQDRMAREHVSDEELHSALRQHGLCEVEEAALAVLEVDGSITIIPKRGATPHDNCDELDMR